MPSKRALVFIVSILFVALVAGCAPPPAATPAGDAQAAPTQAAPVATAGRTPLKVSVSPYLSYAPFYIALEEGFFAEQGLDVEVVKVTRPADALPALAQGDLDVLGTNIVSSLLNAMARESGVRIVASTAQEVDTMNCVYDGFMIRSSLSLTSTADIGPETLRGWRFYANLLSSAGYVLDALLGRYGLSVDDVTILNLSGGATMLAALQENGVDVAHMVEPWITRARAAGVGSVWFSQTAFMPEAQSSVLVFGPSLLKNNPEAGMRFMVAYLKGVRQYREGKTERNLEILAKYLELERDLLLETCFPQVPADGVIFTQSIDEFSKWAAERDYIDRPIMADEFWDPRFVEHAVAVLGQP